MQNRVAAFVLLTAPGITGLVLLSTVVGAWLAPGTMEVMNLVLLFTGVALSSMAANALNAVIDRDRDAVMTRTKNRPIPTGRISPSAGAVSGVLLGAAGLGITWAAAGAAPLALVCLTLFGYVFVYSLWLKPVSRLATEVGGVFGALPPVIGWVAVSGSIDLGAVLLFALVWFWQPPHFWALAEQYRDDYAAVALPVLPVVNPGGVIPLSMGYGVLTVLVSVWVFAAGLGGGGYLVGAIVLGCLFVGLMGYEYKSGHRMPRVRFFVSIVYLTGVFTLLALDRIGILPG